MQKLSNLRKLLFVGSSNAAIHAALRDLLDSQPTDYEIREACVALADARPELYSEALAKDVHRGQIPVVDYELWLWLDKHGQAPIGMGVPKPAVFDVSILTRQLHPPTPAPKPCGGEVPQPAVPTPEPCEMELDDLVITLLDGVADFLDTRPRPANMVVREATQVDAEPVPDHDQPDSFNELARTNNEVFVEGVPEFLDDHRSTGSSAGAMAFRLAANCIKDAGCSDEDTQAAVSVFHAICGKYSLVGRFVTERFERREDVMDTRPTLRVPALAA